MYWLNPWAWVGALSVALPILAHLYSRRPPREAPFPSLRFLAASRLLPTRRTRISDVPLLLVRVLILVTAVAALAQPFWPSTTTSSSTVAVKMVIVDTLSVGGDSAAQSALEQTVATALEENPTSLRVNTDTPHAVLAGASQWLQSQSGRRELIVISDFRRGAIDSIDIAQLPRDIPVRLIRTPNGRGSTVAPASRASGRVQWSSGATAAEIDAIRRAARASGATAVDTVDTGAIDSLVRTLLVMSPGADSASSWIGRARTLDQPWMGDVAAALRRDTSLVTATWSSLATDTVLAAPFAVLLRNATHAPLVAAAALPAANGQTRLLLISRAPVDALATVTLLWSASRALEPEVAPAPSGPITDAQLRQWERAPAAEAPMNRMQPNADARSPLSRWLWVTVLLLLGVETIMRHRLSTIPTPTAA